MALSNEDKKDIKQAHGKALASKIDRVTTDKLSGSLNSYLKKHEKDTVRSYKKKVYFR
jgi:hypothetical protein